MQLVRRNYISLRWPRLQRTTKCACRGVLLLEIAKWPLSLRRHKTQIITIMVVEIGLEIIECELWGDCFLHWTVDIEIVKCIILVHFAVHDT